MISVNPVLDKLLEGGLEPDVLTTIFGPPGSGKSCLCMVCAAAVAKSGKVIYIDTEGGFSVERFKQIDQDFEHDLKNIIVFKPTNFSEQEKVFSELKEHVNGKIRLIIVDSISMLYRYEVGKSENISGVNKSLGMQLSYLVEVARKKMVPSLLTNQVYADFDNPGNIKMVGGDIVRYTSKCLIELKKLKESIRGAIVRKHRSIEENKEIKFKIVKEGIIPQ